MPKLIWEQRPAIIDPDTPFELLQLRIDDVLLHPAAAYHNSSFVQPRGVSAGVPTSC